MMQNILSGFALCFDPTVLFWMLFGAAIGLIVGILPGLGTLLGMALSLPFIFKMQPYEALPFLVALSATGFTGGSITAVLLGVPGESANIVTTFDGYPMTQKGQGARAIGAALTSSLFYVPVFRCKACNTLLPSGFLCLRSFPYFHHFSRFIKTLKLIKTA